MTNLPVREPIAVTGISCRFPQAENPEMFWDLLFNGKDAISDVPIERWDNEIFYSNKKDEPLKIITDKGAFLNDIDKFDSDFFNMSIAEANKTDPQQRLLLELSYEAIEDSGQKIKDLEGKKVGVFIGLSSSDYSYLHLTNPKEIDAFTVSSVAGSVAANRISYIFDFKGPSIVVDTACSSSLTAVHLACQSINSGECETALAGGVNIILSPYVSVAFSRAQVMSPDGICKAFDADANGIVRGEGGGLVVLKPLSKALKDGDQIYGIIKGSAINQDGLTNGLPAPSPSGQYDVLKSAYNNGGINPKDVVYIETHGTGTVLGDAVEAKALGNIFKDIRDENNPCKIGSVKTNIGHLEASAGIAGLIKSLLCFKNGFIVPSLNFNNPNPYIPFNDYRVRVQDTLEKLPENKNLIAGISSFGFGGANAHVVIQNYIENYKKELFDNDKYFILPLSSHTEESLIDHIESYKNFIVDTENDLNDICYTESIKRQKYPYRATLIFKNKKEFIEKADNALTKSDQNITKKLNKLPKIAFVFSGMGSELYNLGKDFLNEPIFKQTIEECDKYMSIYHDWSLIDEIKKGDLNGTDNADKVLPVYFAVQIALAKVWVYYGIKPDVVTGSSVGEIAASYIAGILTLEDAVNVICIRNNAMIKMVGKGAVAIVQLSETEILKEIESFKDIFISAVNSPTMTGISGSEEELLKVIEHFKSKGIFCKLITGAIAPSHCKLMSPVKDIITQEININPQNSDVEFYSTVTGKAEKGNFIDSEYWWKNVSQPIRFYDSVKEIINSGNHIFIEISATPVLSAFITEINNEKKNLDRKFNLTVPTLKKGKIEREQFFESLGYLFCLGFNINWNNIYPNGRCISLPVYSWNKMSHWINNASNENINFSFGDFNRFKKDYKGEKENIKNLKNTQKTGYLNKEIILQSENKKEIIINYLREHVARVLKVSFDDVNVSQPLKNLGIGSLMGMELYNRLKGDLQTDLPISKLLKGPSIEEITNEILLGFENNDNNLEFNKIVKNENIYEKIPLSFSQQRLWFIEKLEKDLFAYNIPIALKLKGEFDFNIFKKCIEVMSTRHEILRTLFKTENGKPYQYIKNNLETPVKLIDLRHENNNNENIFALINNESYIKFYFENEPLLRYVVYKLSDNEHIVLLIIHHLIADGISLKVIFHEISVLYESFKKQSDTKNIPDNILDPLKIQYKDYTLWQIKRFNDGNFDQQIEYWQSKLKDAISVTTFPTDKTRNELQTFNGEISTFNLPDNLVKEIDKLSKDQGVTVFSILLSAFNLVLYFYTGQKDLIIGTPIAGRNLTELEPMIGLFLNMLALRTEINESLSIKDFIDYVSHNTLQAYDNQDLPFEKIVEIIKPERNMSYTPVFQTVLALHADVEAENIGEIKTETLDVDMKTSKFDFTLSFIPSINEFKGIIEYNTDLYSNETIKQIKNHYIRLLEYFVYDKDIRLSEINLVNNNEQNFITENFVKGSNTDLSNETVLDLFNKQVINNPDNIAIYDEYNKISYKELNDKSEKIASFIKNQSAENNEDNKLICIFTGRSTDLIISALGVIKAGYFYLPLDPNYAYERNQIIINESDPILIIKNDNTTNNKLFDEIHHRSINIIDIINNQDINNNLIDNKIKSESTAYVIYTSGTTGKPKGVEITHSNLMNLVSWHHKEFNINHKTKSTLIANTAFDASIWEIWPYICMGSSIYIPDSKIIENPENLKKYFDDNNIDISFIPTPLFDICANSDWNGFSFPKIILTGGDRLLKLPDSKITNNYPFKIYNNYGPTESTVVATSTYIDPNTESINIGKPINNIEIYILDKNLNFMPISAIGEIYIGGKSLAKGYYKNNDLTKNSFIKNPFVENEYLYKTGDLGRFLKDGSIEFIGRNDNQIKLRGHRIELGEIDSVIGTYPDILTSKTVFIENDNKIISYIKIKIENINHSKDINDIKVFLKNKLPDVMIPEIIITEDIPYTENGKVNTKLLKENWKILSIKNYKIKSNDMPVTTIQKEVAQIWEEVLNIKNIGLNDNFFDIGGHSLSAIEIINNLIKKYKIDLSLKDLFNNPTVKNCSLLIENSLLNSIGEFIIPDAYHDSENLYEPFPLTDIQQAYWLGRKNDFELGNIAAHAYLEIKVKGLDIKRFENALNKLIERHTILRTIVLENGTQQIIKNYNKYVLNVYDFINDSSKLLSLREKLSHEILDTSKPLFNICVSKIENDSCIIHISIDGIIADASSMLILGKELTEIYENPEKMFPELKINFRDYINIEKELKESIVYKKSKDYWISRLDTLPSAPQLPLANDPKNIKTPKFKRLSSSIEKDKWLKIKAISANLNMTPSIVLLSAFSKVLSYWTKSDTFTLNLTFFNRLPVHKQIMQITGDFTSLNLLEINSSANISFIDFTKNNLEQLWKDIDHRYISGVSVLRELAKIRGYENNNMPVVFTSMLSDQSNERQESVKLLGDIVYSITQTPQVWLDHQVIELEGKLVFNWDYLEELFPENMIADIFESYCSFLDSLDNYDCWEKTNITLIPKNQELQINKYNQTENNICEKLLHQLFFESAEKYPLNDAVVTSEYRLNYRDLERKVKSLSIKLKHQVNSNDKFIAVVIEKGWEQLVATLAILASGYAYLPINPEHPKERIDYLLNTCEINTIITQDKYKERLNNEYEFNIISINKDDYDNDYLNYSEPLINNDSLAYIIFTSGSTGVPKGVLIDHKGAVNTALDINKRFNITSIDKVFAISSLNFDLSVYDFFGTLATGATIVIPDPDSSRDPWSWEKLMNKEGVTVWNSVPTLMSMLIEYVKDNKERNISTLKKVMLSGDWVNISLVDEIKKINPDIEVISLGGATEASIWSIFYKVNNDYKTLKNIPYGQPLTNQQFYVLDQNLNLCPFYVTGDLYIGGIGLAKGYWKDIEKTNSSFIQTEKYGRIYKTGDIGRYVNNDNIINIEFLGRKDSQVKIQGHRIELSEVESAMLKHEGISSGLVLSYGEAKGEKYLVGYIQKNKNYNNGILEDSEIINFMESKLPCYMVPSIFIEIDFIPLTPNGKVDKKLLPLSDKLKKSEDKYEYNKEYAQKISQIIKDVLQINDLDPYADLLTMGTNSIDVVKIANTLEKEFGFCPKTGDIFRLKTVAKLSNFYEDNKSKIISKNNENKTEFLIDPLEREYFKNVQNNIRKFNTVDNTETFYLKNEETNDNEFIKYKSYRIFDEKIVDETQISDLLNNLKQIVINESYKYQYISAGGLYPVQVYIHIKDNGVENFKEGMYYYNPKQNSLTLLSYKPEIDRDIHFFINQSIYDKCKFSIFLIGDLNAIEPVYGNSSSDYCFIEAGSIAQLLRMEAPKYDLGLCSIGQIDFEKIKKYALLNDKHIHLHTILGGVINNSVNESGFTFIVTEDDDEWEEITI